MTIEEKLALEPYRFKYNKGDVVILKHTEELETINTMLFDASPEFDYDSTKWYLTETKMALLKNGSFTIVSQISWHMGWPFYGVESTDNNYIYIAEFYLKKG